MTTPQRHVHHVLLGALMAALSPMTFAQAFDAVRLYGAAPGEDGGLIGAAVIHGRAFQGSGQRRTLAVPLIDYQWRNGWFAGTTNGVGYNFSSNPGMHYGVRLTADLGRSESRSAALIGLGDIDARPEVGGFFNYHLSQELFLTSSLRYGSGNDRKGMVVDLGAGYSAVIAPSLRLGLGLGVGFANRNYMQSYFGVDAAQSVTSAYNAYSPSAGVRDVRANAALTYRVTPRVGITAGLSLSNLQGNAKDSPIVRRASTVNGLLGASYAF